MNNAYGIPEEELVIRMLSRIISAKFYIEALRDLARRWPLISAGITDLEPSDKFLISLIKDRVIMGFTGSGTHTLLPEDVEKFLAYLHGHEYHGTT